MPLTLTRAFTRIAQFDVSCVVLEMLRGTRNAKKTLSIEKLENTPPRKLCGHGQAVKSAGSFLTSSSLNSSFKNTPIGILTRKVSNLLRNKSLDGGEGFRSDRPLISGTNRQKDCSVSSPDQSASVLVLALKDIREQGRRISCQTVAVSGSN
jgi:hypothetical protein